MISGTKELVDDYLLANREYRQRDQGHTRTGWRSSSLGYCLRKQTYDRLGVARVREFDAKTLKTFSLGDNFHFWLKGFYKQAGVLIKEEGKLRSDGRSLVGHYDMLIGGEVQDITDAQRERWSPWWTEWVEGYRQRLAEVGFLEPGVVLVDELKSTNARAFGFIRKDGPKEAHMLQVGSYLSMAEEEQDPVQLPVKPTGGRLTYVAKDDGSIQEFDARDEWVSAADAVVDQLNNYWADEELPPCTCEGWQVGYCDFLKPEARTPLGTARKGVKGGGVDCCPEDLYKPALEAHNAAIEAEKGTS